MLHGEIYLRPEDISYIVSCEHHDDYAVTLRDARPSVVVFVSTLQLAKLLDW